MKKHILTVALLGASLPSPAAAPLQSGFPTLTGADYLVAEMTGDHDSQIVLNTMVATISRTLNYMQGYTGEKTFCNAQSTTTEIMAATRVQILRDAPAKRASISVVGYVHDALDRKYPCAVATPAQKKK